MQAMGDLLRITTKSEAPLFFLINEDNPDEIKRPWKDESEDGTEED